MMLTVIYPNKIVFMSKFIYFPPSRIIRKEKNNPKVFFFRKHEVFDLPPVQYFFRSGKSKEIKKQKENCIRDFYPVR